MDSSVVFFSVSRSIFMVHTRKPTVLAILVMFLFADHRSFFWNNASKPQWVILALTLRNAGAKNESYGHTFSLSSTACKALLYLSPCSTFQEMW